MTRKEKVYFYINSKEYIPLNFSELCIVLDVPEADRTELLTILNELIYEGKIFLTKKEKYAPCESNKLFSGILRCNAKGKFGFVSCEDSHRDIYIPKDKLGTALDGDSVLVKVTKHEKSSDEGFIASVLKRNSQILSAVLTDDFTALSDNQRIFKRIKLTESLGAKRGDRVLIEIADFTQRNFLIGSVTKILGSANDIKTLTDALIFESGIKCDFDIATISNSESLSPISNHDIQNRCDFREAKVFTIDGDDSKDFDDAVSLELLENGNFKLGVHIADVTHYVTEGSSLDNEAYTRGTSVYLPDRVIPMLPPKLSNDLCSLNPHEDRLTLSVIMEIDKNGELLNHTITESIICSCERMTYNNVAKILDGDTTLCEQYAYLVPTLKNMHTLAEILSNRRKNRGSINFDFPESQIVLNNQGLPQEIKKVIRNDAHKLIEEFMLVANETVAEFAFWADIPFVFRIHDKPNDAKMTSFRQFISGFGLYMKGKDIHPNDLSQILEKISGTDCETVISAYMLRSLMKAEYKDECLGHFGLSAKYYCHFTSPIRRYPDLIIHRILKDYLKGNDVLKYKSLVSDAAARSSDTEKSAELLERNCDDLFKTAYIANFVGAEFTATVSGITSFGMFAELPNTIEGLIRLESMADDYYELDEENHMLVGKRHGRTYQVGDQIKIEVVRADIGARQIDFSLCYNRNKRGKKHG